MVAVVVLLRLAVLMEADTVARMVVHHRPPVLRSTRRCQPLAVRTVAHRTLRQLHTEHRHRVQRRRMRAPQPIRNMVVAHLLVSTDRPTARCLDRTVPLTACSRRLRRSWCRIWRSSSWSRIWRSSTWSRLRCSSTWSRLRCSSAWSRIWRSSTWRRIWRSSTWRRIWCPSSCRWCLRQQCFL